MKSQNLEYLRPHWLELADLGAHAEKYAVEDSQSVLIKQRFYTAEWEVTFNQQKILHYLRKELIVGFFRIGTFFKEAYSDNCNKRN